MKPTALSPATLLRMMSPLLMAVILSASTPATAQSAFQLLHDFDGTDGGLPIGDLISDAAGNLYGVTNGGGLQNTAICNPDVFPHYCGTVFSLSKTSSGEWTATVLHEFTGGSDGANPAAGLVMDSAGNLYGTTTFGGSCPFAFGCGVVFELSPTTSGEWTETVLYSFQSGNDGGAPESQMVFDSAGNLYGTTVGGGSGSCGLGVPCGVVFELSPTSAGPWTETVIYSFATLDDGAEPTGTLVFDSHGNLYGTTSSGGSSTGPCGYPGFGCGTVFQLSPTSGGWNKTTLHTFLGLLDGASPNGGVILDPRGNLYGTTHAGGAQHLCGFGGACGVVYKLSPNSSGGWTENVLLTFRPRTSSGQQPVANVTLDSHGNLYGIANGGKLPGGARGSGVVFKLTVGGGAWTETILHTFSLAEGASPASTLLLDSAGNLFGTTSGGGTQNQTVCGGYCGTVFEVIP